MFNSYDAVKSPRPHRLATPFERVIPLRRTHSSVPWLLSGELAQSSEGLGTEMPGESLTESTPR